MLTSRKRINPKLLWFDGYLTCLSLFELAMWNYQHNELGFLGLKAIKPSYEVSSGRKLCDTYIP
jgi:hypothetical protein